MMRVSRAGPSVIPSCVHSTVNTSSRNDNMSIASESWENVPHTVLTLLPSCICTLKLISQLLTKTLGEKGVDTLGATSSSPCSLSG